MSATEHNIINRCEILVHVHFVHFGPILTDNRRTYRHANP